MSEALNSKPHFFLIMQNLAARKRAALQEQRLENIQSGKLKASQDPEMGDASSFRGCSHCWLFSLWFLLLPMLIHARPARPNPILDRADIVKRVEPKHKRGSVCRLCRADASKASSRAAALPNVIFEMA